MTELVPGLINDRWQLSLTPDREEFHRLRPGWEAERLVECARLMRPGEVVWDLGAESGDFTALYAQWVNVNGCATPGASAEDMGTVCVVEPSPEMWPQLRTHWMRNVGPDCPPRVIGFVGDTSQVATDPDQRAYAPSPDGEWPECSFGDLIPEPGFRHLAGQPTMYDQWTIDDLATPGMGDFPQPDHIVMDIEGAELLGLRGASAVLAGSEPFTEGWKPRPYVWCSIHPPVLAEWYGSQTWEIHDLMRRTGYVGRFLGFCTEELWLFAPRERLPMVLP